MNFSRKEPRIGIALGGGGVRGLAHLPFLAVLDDMGIRPHAIAGTSMGAVVGTLYASGVAANEIRSELARHVITKNDTLRTVYQKRKDLVKWFEVIRVELGTGGVLRVDGLLNYLFEKIEKRHFEEMEIPITVIATDYWTGKEVRFTSGDMLPAVRASMAVPGVFTPVQHGGRMLVDGGLVNVLPFDVLQKGCDITIAIDVGVNRTPVREDRLFPPQADAIMRSFEIQQDSMLREKMNLITPDIYIRPDFENIGLLEFDKMNEVFEVAELNAGTLKRELEELLVRRNKWLKSLSDFLPIG